MKSFLTKNHRLLFYLLWLVLALMQAGLTELQDDEAYYWVFSKYPGIGYFDHPPMIAFLVKMGYSLFHNELGVRLFPLLLNLFSLFLIEKLLDKKSPLLFYTIALSIAALQLSGFVAMPDTPLLFFTALFFLCYKKFIERSSWRNTIILGVSVALLFYTKYQGLLVVVFTLLSNLKLLAKPRLYIAGITALLLFAPHLIWQWEHNWVSFRYHLFESNVDPYKFSYTMSYLGGQLLLAGPLAGFLLLPAAFLYKPRSVVERSLKWTLVGIYFFFLLSSFRGQVEPNWTSPALVPLIVLSHQYLLSRPRLVNWLLRLLPFTLMLIAFARIVMIMDILPIASVKKKFHAWKSWPAEMKKRTKGLPVVFSNSYQRASKYWFYSGQMTYSQNHVMDHRNNYNYLPVEDELLGRPVYFLDIYNLDRFKDSLKTPLGYIGYRYDSSFLSFAKINFEPERHSYTLQKDRPLLIKGSARMNRYYLLYIRDHPSLRAAIKFFIFKKKRIIKEILLPLTMQDIILKDFSVETDPGLPPGRYYFRFSIQTPGYNSTHNSEKISLLIK